MRSKMQIAVPYPVCDFESMVCVLIWTTLVFVLHIMRVICML